MSLTAEADLRQRRAADPGASVWVAASAGTGKTKVLTDRVLTLLLAGALPRRLLCLTFTKAAAAEMALRLNRRLAGWATQGDPVLIDDLTRLLGRPPAEAEQVRARRLFAQVLDTPGGMAIQTLHAFCQSLLRRFPLEAGVAPHFQVMDEADAVEGLEAAKLQVLTAAREGDQPLLAEALAGVTARIHELSFPDLLNELASERGRLKRILSREGGCDAVITALETRLGLPPGATADSVCVAACAETSFDGPGLRAAVSALERGGKTDQARSAALAVWLADPAGRVAGWDEWSAQFLTLDGEIRKTLATKAVREADPAALAALSAEAERVQQVRDRICAAEIAAATRALLTLGTALLEAYHRHKATRAAMDYDDLILTARDLLARPGQSSWVQYKLDGGIDHVLIDEAQDTNPDQWAVVAALTEEFFAGDGISERIRTVFAVGDAKQSIYSFQRADPRAFAAMRERFARLVPEAGRRWDEVALNLSFRSGEAVLAAVNAVFAPGQPGRDGVAETGTEITHLAHRSGAAGRVELWPPVVPRPLDVPPPWKPPVERIRGDSPQTRLARLLATRIAAMIGRERLESRGRTVRAGDILVLVRRRGPLVEDLVRELKSLKVAVAGADRMVLTDQMAVMDLMALGRFLLLPDDDLTLATVLKGPLIGLDETLLFTLAYRRGDASLWESLRRRRSDHPAFDQAASFLSDLLSLSDRLSPQALYARILGPLGGRRALLARLGQEAEDPIDEFMALALAVERSHPPSLQGFLHWLDTSQPEIKRDLEQSGRDAVRIMTVHGAKGLQAPIVILPDTLQIPKQSGRLLWLGDEAAGAPELPAWAPRAEEQDPVCRAAGALRKQAREQEYRRLLYVAMTRAEDWLIVCGWETRKAAPEGCWYGLIRDALAPLLREEAADWLAQAGESPDSVLRVLTCPQRDAVIPEAETASGPEPLLPEWARRPVESEPAPPRPLTPSRPDEEAPPVQSPLDRTGEAGRWRRGILIHRLLQTLPTLPRNERTAAMEMFLARPVWGVSTGEQRRMAAEVSALLDHADFAPLFGPGALAEVPVLARIGERVLSGRIDRLVVQAETVLVVDYKTNRRPPVDPDGIPPVYVRQMAAYRLALTRLYPGHQIRCLLLWTDGPRLMEIPAAQLDAAFTLEGAG